MATSLKLGTQGLTVPAIGLGCMGMSEFYGPSDRGSNLAVLDRAIEIGCCFWDTSDMYGPFTNEELIGEALHGRRDKVVVATKFGISRGPDGEWLGLKGNADYVRASCEQSLKRLATDHIDLYYQHRVDPDTPIEETVGAMAELVREGKVRFIGLCEADSETIERVHSVHPLSALQTEYSLWSREVEQTILPTVQHLGIGFVAYSPLGRGFLSGAISDRTDLGDGDWRLSNPRFSEHAIAQNRGIVDRIAKIAESRGATPAQIALAWVLSRWQGLAAIPGTRRIRRLEENWAAQAIALSSGELASLSTLADIGVAGERY